jgi:MFS family permease
MRITNILTEYWHFLLVFGCLGGIGTALMFTPCIAAVGHWFKNGRGNATGIAVSSGAFGGIVFPLMLEQLIPQIGFAWSARIIGCIYIVLCATANLLVKSRLPPIENASTNPDFRIFSHPEFAITVAGVFLLEWALFVPLAYICSYATAQGFPTSMSYNILIFLNVGSVFGRILPGYLADRMGRYNTNIIVIFFAILSIYGVWWPLGSAAGGLTAFALLFGFASGSNISLAPVCLGELCRTEEYGRYYATCFTVVSFGCLTGMPIAGRLISSANGDYWALILFTGSCYVGGLAAFVSARMLARGWKLRIKY